MAKLPDIQSASAQWYNEVIYQAELADQSPVRGALVIRPYGYALWEHIKERLDQRIKATGHENAAFPLLIPESFIKREAEHVQGFAPELAVVTHAGGKKLDEPLAIRPTSETIIHYMFAKWLRSWRDLPIKINQWANVVRWELRPRPFLRTTEFFWQEGHTAHETYQEADAEAQAMLEEYRDLAENYLAIPVVVGRKSENEKFPGAEKTLTIEALMRDGKALQMGTSHMLSQSFARSFDMSYQDRNESISYPYLTSWGVTTRLVGALVMVHGDQKGLRLPPKVAPTQVVIVPIYKNDTDKSSVLSYAFAIEKNLVNAGIRVACDTRDYMQPGAKFYHWELKGVPVRIEVGPRDVAQDACIIADRLGTAKESIASTEVAATVCTRLDAIQQQLFNQALERRKQQWHVADSLETFGKKLVKQGGFYHTGWCENAACEEQLKGYQASIRCIVNSSEHTTCFACNAPSKHDILVAKAY